MKISIKKWFIYIIIAGVISSVLASIIRDWLLNIKILSSLKEIIVKFNYPITMPLWIVILLFLILLLLYVKKNLIIKHVSEKPFNPNEIQKKILLILSGVEERMNGLDAFELAYHHNIVMPEDKIKHNLDLLLEQEYICRYRQSFRGAPTKYKLAKKGKAYLVKNSLI